MDNDSSQSSESAVANFVHLVTSSPLFDPLFYGRQAGIEGTPAGLAWHYLTVGEPALLPPSAEFDLHFYRSYNPDIIQADVSPLLHYIQHGQREHRYCNRARLQADARQVEASGLFDAQTFTRNRGRPPFLGLTEIEDYLVSREIRAPTGDAFDGALYWDLYPDASTTHGNPLLHYLDIGLQENRVVNQHDLYRRKEAIRPQLNPRHYVGQLPAGTVVADPLEHYILHGSRLGLDPSADFSADYYLRSYPDIRVSGMDPFHHFAVFGMAEGRVGRPDFTAAISRGGVAYDLAKPTILVTSHEASRTGAPLVGLNVGACLAATYNVISYLGRGGSLLEDFRAHSCLVVFCAISPLDAEYLLRSLKQTHGLTAVLLNSVETSPFAQAALHAELPSLALIHEFAEYTFPPGRMTSVIESVDRAIAPADLIRDSLQAELTRTRAGPANNIIVRPQGYLPQLPKDDTATDMTREELLAFMGVEPNRKVRLVLGAGFVQMRKGVDLFVQTAAEVRRLYGEDFRFLWVGDGYDPTGDLSYSAWVGDMVRRLDLERTVFFLPSQSSLDTLFALSDVFFLPSRLDPFPNVVLDAFKAGRAVVCFDRATGSASVFQGPGAAFGAAVSYCNVPEAAQALVQAFRPADMKRALANTKMAERRFSFADYMDALAVQLEAARTSHAAVTEATRRIEESGLFDAGFHDGITRTMDPAETRRAIRSYVAQGMKGLMQHSPRPGFNEGLARIASGTSPALGAPGAPAVTHRCIMLEDGKPIAPFTGRVALHLHLYYPELADGFLSDLVAAGSTADLIVTTTSDAKSLEIAYALRKYKAGSTRVIVVPNRGRDIGPLLTEIGRFVRGGEYDIVGHLHGKRSLAVNTAMGTRWRAYLTGLLLGGKSGLASVLAPFEQDQTLGLLFPEDRHLVGWTKNHGIAADLAARMTPSPTVPEWPLFPVGTMFWARPAALEPLWTLKLKTADFPPEPLPYDGTMLHAIERLLPSVCEAAGLSWGTIYQKGVSW